MLQLTCIGCPLGCALSVELFGEKVEKVSGFTCGRGKAYAAQEAIDPQRTVTSTVRIFGAGHPVLPVRTAGEVPKDRIWACMEQIRALTAEAPVHVGEILLENIAGTGVALVAAKTMERADALTDPKGQRRAAGG